MEIKVLGTGCPKCTALYQAVAEVTGEMGVSVDLKKVEKLEEIIETGVMLTPALMINGKLKFSGKAPKKEELKKYIEEEQ